ncbi:hypothetical protein SAMN05428995_102302 [Loktanella sp. DSM 29012]|uniref:excinuclease ABC subunit B n=1 Tax=Loktanella sp. DSM 29012 TaxID=1881056 RepID=UPI0008C7E7C8|nr:excinuclease ABC subunit B [Loktanella sp. DSM 29012]SEQ01044.1 hypothetical protein SAMN05428995_102302 [Loktanella sp. DSM 29012]
MRLLAAILLTCAAQSAAAWTFKADPICKMIQPTGGGSITVTYDPATGEYAMMLTLVTDHWVPSDRLTMAFIGARPFQISTDRHFLSDNDTRLTVTDTGFGNVLDGLQFNDVAQVRSGDQTMTIPLAGAAEAVAAFRNCPAPQLS